MFRQTLDHIIAKLSKEKKPSNGVDKKTRILLVSFFFCFFQLVSFETMNFNTHKLLVETKVF